MAIPETLYAISTVAQSPSSSLTDFTFIVDLSQLPQAWWDAVDTSDGARGRVAKDDETELASDWLEIDAGAQTGVVRIKWSGTASGSETVRIYPPKSANDSYLPSATFGSYNAYDSNWGAYWAKGGSTDRTTNQFDLTSTSGTLTEGGLTGVLGEATDYDGSGKFERLEVQTTGSANRTFLVWSKNTQSLDNYLSLGNDDDIGPDGERWTVRNSGGSLRLEIQGAGQTSSLSVGTTVPQFIGARLDGSTLGDHTVFVDSSSEQLTGTDTVNTAQTTPTTCLGGRTDTQPDAYNDGEMSHAQMHTIARSDAWIEHERIQINDNSTFWGAWSVVQNYTLDLAKVSYAVSGKSAGIIQDYLINANKGNYSVTGKDANLLKSYRLGLSKSGFTIVGKELGILRQLSLGAEKGIYTVQGRNMRAIRQLLFDAQKSELSLSGKDMVLIRSIIIEAGAGNFSLSGKSLDYLSSNIFLGSTPIQDVRIGTQSVTIA